MSIVLRNRARVLLTHRCELVVGCVPSVKKLRRSGAMFSGGACVAWEHGLFMYGRCACRIVSVVLSGMDGER
jgi:hypothetical protein